LQVVFLSFACSGAEITAGLLKPYAGRQTYGQLAVQLRTYLPNTGPVAANRLKSRGPGSVGKGQEFECRRVQVHKAGAVYGAKTCDRSGGCPETLTVREPMLDCRGVVDREIDHDIDACDALCVSTATGLQHSDEAYVGYLPSQLNALLDAICERPSTGPAQSPTSFSIRPCARFERPIDALWLSIGGNDVGFGLVLKTALLYANAFDLAGFRRERENEVGRLAEKYNELADALRDHVASKQEVKPEIFLTQYPDPTYANVFDEGEKDQRRCGVRPKVTQFQHRTVVSYIADLFFFRGASENEIGDLRTHVVDPLQGAVKEAAKAHEWTLVDGHVEPSEMHGYCNLWKDSASDPWFHTHDDSLSRQGNLVKAFDSEGGYSTGVMHPNILGLRSMADALVDESVKKLRIQTSK
jgi:hypothetical protein